METSDILIKMVVKEIELSDRAFSKPTVMKLVGVVCGLNDGGAAAAAKIIFIAMNEKSDFWADEFPR